MYFDDLTPYTYSQSGSLRGVLNIGWLDADYPYAKGKAPLGFIEALKQWLVRAKTNQTRGFEMCRFCGAKPRNLSDYRPVTVNVNGVEISLGSAEIWIPGGAGQIFASPTLIVHYVDAHQYLPPKDFIEAVLQPIAPEWDATAIAERMREKGTEP